MRADKMKSGYCEEKDTVKWLELMNKKFESPEGLISYYT
jgi:hypothetical protein